MFFLFFFFLTKLTILVSVTTLFCNGKVCLCLQHELNSKKPICFHLNCCLMIVVQHKIFWSQSESTF